MPKQGWFSLRNLREHELTKGARDLTINHPMTKRKQNRVGLSLV